MTLILAPALATGFLPSVVFPPLLFAPFKLTPFVPGLLFPTLFLFYVLRALRLAAMPCFRFALCCRRLAR